MAVTIPTCLLNEYNIELLIPETYQPTMPAYTRKFGVRGLRHTTPGEMSLTYAPVTWVIDLLYNNIEHEIRNSAVMVPIILALIDEYLDSMQPYRGMIKESMPEQESFLVKCEYARRELLKWTEVLNLRRESAFIAKFGRDALPKTLNDIMGRLA